MSCHKHNFHCFSAVGREGYHKSSLPFEHHTTWLPRIPQHGMAAYHELEQECRLCSAYRHVQTLEDAENQLLPFYHTHPPYHHQPHQYVLRGPSGHEETHSANECHLHDRRNNKKIVLVKNSDPSFKKTIMLHFRGLRSFGLFLEEVSELMQYHIRKLYTQEGCKVDSVQSLLQCPGVLICVGREPSHPLIMENFDKTSSYTLPRLSGKSRATERTEGKERLTAKTSIILPNLEDDNRATKHSVSSGKSVPDGRDSADIVNSCPPGGDSMRDDDIEKQVRVNKDGSLSMEMKVRFRLPNDETLHWFTKVNKTAGWTYDHIKGHNNPNLTTISDVRCSESEIMSADETYFTHHYQGHKEKCHCPYCCSHCQGYETWKNVPGTHGASRCSHSSSSSASSHIMVSRKTVIERQTMSRSSEELADQVVEVTQIMEAAEMVDFCTIQRETCSPKCNVKPSTMENDECTSLYNNQNNLDLKTAQESYQEEEEQAGYVTRASHIFTGDKEKDNGNDRSFSQISNPDRKETNEMFDTGLLIQQLSPVSKEKASKSSEHHTKPKTLKPSYFCHCGESASAQIEPKEKIKTKSGAEDEMQIDKSSAMSVESDTSCRSNKSEEIQKVQCIEEGGRSKSAMSVKSNASINCNSAVFDVTTEGLQAGDDKETKERTSSSLSMKSFKSSKSVKAPHVQHKSEEDLEKQAMDDSELRTQSSLSALSTVSAELKTLAQEASEEEDNQNTAEENEKDSEPRVKSVISEKSNVSTLRTSEGTTKKRLLDNQSEGEIRPSSMSDTSGRSSVSPTSSMSLRQEDTSVRATSALSSKSNISTKSRESKTHENCVTKKANIKENYNTEGVSELRPQSKLSVKSEKSVKSNKSAKSSKCKTSEVAHNESCDNMKDDYCNITETPDTAETRASSVVSDKSVGSKSVTPTKQNACRNDEATVERAGSAISFKSDKSHTSVVSLKSETSQVSTNQTGNLCDEKNYLHSTAGRSSSMSDKSMKSNISVKSSKSNGCHKLDKGDMTNEEERGPSVMSVKSPQSDVTTESTYSKTSAKSNPLKPSDAIAEGNSVDQLERRERAPSNISTASAKSSKSHASATCENDNASEVCCDPPERIFSEEEIEGRSMSSMSVQSVRSNISSSLSRSNCSIHAPPAEATDLFNQEREEMNTEIRAASSTSTKSVESQQKGSGSAMGATSTKSNVSAKSTKSNTSNMCSSIRNGEGTSEETIQERVLSALSVKSTKSTASTESTKTKCYINALQEKSSKTSNQENDNELPQERSPSRGSPVSERSAKSAERPHSALSAKSRVSDIEIVATAELSDEGDCEDETEERAQSVLSTKSVKSTKSTEHDGLYENISNHGERASSNMSARSEKSTKPNISTVSKKSKVAAGCLESVYPEERVVEEESELRPMSRQSVDSTVSTKSNLSMHSAYAEGEDGSLANEVEKHNERGEDRPPSSMSAKSVQSCMSEISIKSAERTQSSLSAKSFKSSTTEIYSGKSPDESNIIGPTQTKSESVLSCKSERSASSAKSTKSNGLDIRGDEKMVDDDEHVERAPSNLSAKSEKSTKSNVSKGCKTLVSKVCLKHKAVDPDKRGAENGSENKPLSPQSVRSNTSVKSNRSKCCIDSLVAKRLDISDNENDKETNIERARSSMSTGSVQSSVSDISIKSEERTASALSEKSHASLISEITNISEVPSGIPALPEEVDSEDKERTQSVMSVKSTNSSISDKSTKSARLDHEKHTERSSSNLSVKSGRSAKSNLSKRSEVYEVHLENSADNCDVRIVDGESEGSTISVVSAQSVRSQCERFDDDNNENENHERPPSSTSAKSVLSCISQKSAKSADRPPSASSAKSAKSHTSAKSVLSCISQKSAKSADRPPSASSAKSAKSHTSAKSVQSNISDAKSGKTVEMYKKGTESHEKTNSALSSKTAKSTTSTKSSKVKEHGEDGQHKDRNPSSMSARSATSAKSNVSAVTCEPSSKSGDEDTSQEDSEIRSVSSMSIHSAKSDISARSGMSKCSTDIPGHEIMKRPDSPSAMSAQILAGSTEGCACDLDQVERPISNLSIKSAKSATSNVSGTSTKSKASNILSEQEIAASDIEGQGNSSSSQMTKSNVSGCSKKSRCSDVSDSILNEENTNERSSVNTSANVKTTKSSTSTKSCELQKPGEQRHVENMNSNSSIKSTTSRHSDGRSNDSETLDLSPENFVSSVSTKSKASHSQTANEEDQSQRTHSALSIKSDASSRTIQSNRSHITPTKGIRKDDNKLIDPDIPTEESDAHSDADALEKCERTQSPASKKSPKSKYDFVLSEESSKYVEERTGSPVSTKSDLSEALSRSEVPYVTVEESEDRPITATSLKSKASGRSKKSKTSEIQGARSARKSQSSLSVHSHLSVKSKKTNVTDMSTASVVSKNTGEHVTPTEDSTPCLYEEVKDGPTDKKHSKTKRSRRQRTENADICPNKHPIICHADSAESDKSHTLSCSDNMKEICETSSPGESESHVSKRIVNGLLKAADTVSDKSDMDAHDFELVPSILPNASPTEVVNEWLKTLPTESDLYDMEELNENSDGVKDNVAAEEGNGTEDAEKNESEAENLKEVNGMDNVHNDDSQKSTESPNEDKTYTQRECGSEMFNSSIQVMKVLLNSKLDRCNSLPEISPVYGRKLSTSAKGLLDCFVKLRIIDYDPENANEKNERYQELMSILQSLWLSDPPEKEHIQSTTDHHSVEGEYNHTSSSGVDVNSGSTGSGKSSDGVKSSNDVNVDGSQPQNSLTLIDKAHNETDAQSKPEIEEVKQEEDDPATDETMRTIDSPKELPETPSSSNKSSGESSVNDKKVSKRLSQDPDPVWVLTLLNKIEKQFMTHYISAMKELKNRWSLEDTDQLDKMIDELKSEVHKKIQISIDREVRKIRGRGGLPKPPNEAISRGSTKQTEERRRRMKIKQQQSMDSQAEKSDSTTGTSDSDQRGENIDEYCPCETCVEKKLTSRPPLSAEVKRTAPVVKDYDLKKILLMKTTTDWEAPCANDNDTTVETLVEKVIVGAMKEIESNEVYKVRDKPPEFSADEKEKDNVSQDGQATIKETGKDFAIDNEGEISKAGNERPESESGATSTVGEITSGVETASEEGTDDAITPSGEIGSNANIELEEKDTDMLGRVSVDEDEEEITETMSSEHRYITAATKELPNHLNEINDDTDANTEVQSKEESEQEGKDALVKEVSSTKLNANHGEAMKDWLNMKRKLLPSVRIVLQGKKKKQSMMNAKNNDTVMINEMVKDRTEEEESDAEIAVVQKTTVLSENASSEEADYSEAEDNEPAVEVNKTQTTDVKFSEEEDEEAEMDEESFLEMTSNATLSDDEKAETSSIATSEHGSENDMIVEQTHVATLTDQNSDMEETGEGTTSDHDSVEESGGTSDGDETEDEKETTINELSSIQEEEATEDELSVISETQLKKHLITVVGYEDAEETNEAESEVKTSERDVEKDSIADEKKTISPVNSDDSPDENEPATAKFSEGPDEGAEDGMGVRNQPAVTGEHKTVLPPRTDQESDDEKNKEGRQVDPKEEMEAADVLKSSSVKREDENEESETAASEQKSEKDAAEEEGTGTDEEKLSAISENVSGDENRDLSIEDESSEEHNKGGTTENEISTDNGESKNEVAKDETAADGTDIEISEEAGTVDDGEETAGESDSAEDINGITNDDGTAEDIDAMSSELSIEHAESDTKAEQTGDEATVTATSVQESDKNEVVEEEEVVDWEEQPVKVKNRHDLVLTSEAEDDSEEDEINADTTENESGKDAVEEAMNRQGSDSGDETNEEKEDKLKEEQSIEATDAEEEDTVKSKSDSAEDNDAFSNDETSAAETEHEINKPYESKEKEPGETTDCEESDPGSQIEGSSKALSENESEEEGNSSGIDDERSANNLTASTGETTGQEDTSTVKGDDELRDKDSEAKFEDEIAVETSQEYPDENEPLSKAEHVEQLVLAKELKSSGKVEESIEDFQEEKKSKNVETCDVDKLVEDETPLEESESIENESESESKCEDCSEAASKRHEDNKVTDGSEEENEPQFTEKEDEDSDTPHEGCSESLGDSADGEDEAEEDSEPEEDTNNGQTSFAAEKLESLDATKRAAKKTLLIPLDTLRKERTESEDGAYADIEDSEHEIHGQKDVTSLESKSLKKV